MNFNYKGSMLLLMLFFFGTAQAQWTSINPGAGGQVQDVVCDPNQRGVLYLASDMEGVYKSTDNGESWSMTGHLVHNRVYAVAVTPTNSEQIYVGTLNGVHSSSDGGIHYQYHDISFGKSISAITVNPSNPKQVIAGVGWRDDYNFLKFIKQKKSGRPEIVFSNDGGEHWETMFIADQDIADRNVLNISFNPVNKSEIFVSTYGGIFTSKDAGKSWEQIELPSHCIGSRGVSISPDGQRLYAVLTHEGINGLPYVSPTAKTDWQVIQSGNGIELTAMDYWYPEVDERSSAQQERLILSLQKSRKGAFEATLKYDQQKLKDYQWDLVWSGLKGYDTGWDFADPNPRFIHYTPKSWPRAIWSTSNQTIFEGADWNGGYQWNNKYCKVSWETPVTHYGRLFPTYQGRGTESTYTYDIAVDENYVIQGQADNGLMESWDGGKSWSNMAHRTDSINYSDVQSVTIAHANGTPVVLAQATSGYGGHAKDGRLLYKVLQHHSPEDEWKLLAGGPNHELGMPDGIFREIAVDPTDKERVFVFSYGHGIYLIDNLSEAINNPDYKAQKISSGVVDKVVATKRIAVDPNNPKVIYFTGTRGYEGLFKGELKKGKWRWNRLFDGGGWDAEVVAWSHQGKTHVLYGGRSADKKDGDDYVFKLMIEGQKGWKRIFDKSAALAFRKEENKHWYPYSEKVFLFETKGGLAAYDDKIIINIYNHRQQNSYGIFIGTLSDQGEIAWQDFTGDIHYPGLTGSKIVDRPEGKYWYVSTAGAGAWFRKLPTDTMLSSH